MRNPIEFETKGRDDNGKGSLFSKLVLLMTTIHHFQFPFPFRKLDLK